MVRQDEAARVVPGLPLERLAVVVHAENPRGVRREDLEQVALRDQNGRARVFQHERQAFLRVGRVERDVGSSGLQDAEEGRDEVVRATQAHGHQRLRFDTQADETVGHAVGVPVKLAVGEATPPVHDRDRLRRSPRLRLEQLVDAAIENGIPARVIPFLEDPPSLVLRQRGELIVPRQRILRHRGKHAGVDGRDLLDLPPGQIGRAVVQRHRDARGRLIQVELGGQREVGLLESVAAPQIDPSVAVEPAVHVEIRVVEGGVGEELPPGHALQLGHREATIRQHRALRLERETRQVAPRSAVQPHAERQGIEEDPENLLAVRLFGPAVGDETRGDVPAPGVEAHHLHVRREQNALQRHAGRPRLAL